MILTIVILLFIIAVLIVLMAVLASFNPEEQDSIQWREDETSPTFLYMLNSQAGAGLSTSLTTNEIMGTSTKPGLQEPVAMTLTDLKQEHLLAR